MEHLVGACACFGEVHCSHNHMPLAVRCDAGLKSAVLAWEGYRRNWLRGGGVRRSFRRRERSLILKEDFVDDLLSVEPGRRRPIFTCYKEQDQWTRGRNNWVLHFVLPLMQSTTGIE